MKVLLDIHQADVFDGGMVGKGRTPIGRVIPVRFDEHTRAQLDQIAADRHMKLAEVIRDLVNQALKEQP
jgi:hypothetical protein